MAIWGEWTDLDMRTKVPTQVCMRLFVGRGRVRGKGNTRFYLFLPQTLLCLCTG